MDVFRFECFLLRLLRFLRNKHSCIEKGRYERCFGYQHTKFIQYFVKKCCRLSRAGSPPACFASVSLLVDADVSLPSFAKTNAFLPATLTRVVRATVPNTALASAFVLQSLCGGSVVGFVGPL